MRAMLFVLALTLATPAVAQTALKPPLQPLSFLVGEWKSDDGKVAETGGGTSKGGSNISVASDGWALLREDHTELFDRDGKPAGGFHQTMMIYPDNGIHADYVDGEGHAIHYVSAEVEAGKSVTFESAADHGPVFRLSYVLEAPDRLAVRFAMIPPGQNQLRPIAVGSLTRVR